jgi:hypothetical protein
MQSDLLRHNWYFFEQYYSEAYVQGTIFEHSDTVSHHLDNYVKVKLENRVIHTN